MSDQNPRRNPLACGALGRYDPALVAEIGRRLAGEVSAVHEDGSSVLLLDRRRNPLAGAAHAGVRMERRPPRQAQRHLLEGRGM